jgi:hypothetical protein
MDNVKKIQEQKTLLEKYGAIDSYTYIKKLEDNINNKANFEDLIFEGKSALLFLKHGFNVQMRESPDLYLFLDNNCFFAEVKHFREKRQDIIDSENMKNAQNELVIYGDTLSLEGITPWEQVFNVVKRKKNSHIKDNSNILIIGSSSTNCIDDSIFLTVINMIDESDDRAGLSNFNGIMLLSRNTSCNGRNVFFYPTKCPYIEMDNSMLHNIKNHRQITHWNI